MNYNLEIPKIKRYSHNLRIVMNVFYWVAIIATCATLVAAIVIILISDSNFTVSEGTLKHLGFTLNGILRYNLNEVPQEIILKRLYITIMLMSASIFALIIPVLKQLILILKTVEEDRPFAVENAKRILTIGVVLTFSSILIPAFEVLVTRTMVDTLKIQNVSINYSINISLIFTGFMLLILSGIFNYGSYLQHEYDETV